MYFYIILFFILLWIYILSYLFLFDYTLCIWLFMFWLWLMILEPVRPRLLASYSVLYTQVLEVNFRSFIDTLPHWKWFYHYSWASNKDEFWFNVAEAASIDSTRNSEVSFLLQVLQNIKNETCHLTNNFTISSSF